LTAPAPADAPTARRLALGFGALAATTYVLIVLGALVRAHGAGLACPDWPLCFGEVIPELDFKVAFEWGHRVLAGSVGLVFLALSAFTLRSPGLGRPMRAGLGVAAILLGTQVVLGGLTVLELLASWTVTSHLVTGNAFALSVVLLTRRLIRLSEPAGSATPPARPTLRIMAAAAACLLFAQIVLGGLVSSSYAGLVCPDWPTCANGAFFPTWRGIQGIHVIHRTVGYTLVLVLGGTAWIARPHPTARRWWMVAAGLVVAQVGAGIANVLLRLPVEVTALHSALAAGLVCTVGVGVRESFRGVLSPRSGACPDPAPGR
jgi:cytochrome c oxidase assembly protein subunit 15